MKKNNQAAAVSAKQRGASQKIKTLKKGILRHWQMYFIVFLPVLWLILFQYTPLIGSQIAFRDYTFNGGIWGSKWAGLKHFKNFLASPQFSKLMVNTLGLSFYNIIAGVLPPIILAIAINYTQRKWFKKTAQMITYMPYFISTVLVVGILQQLLSLSGPVNGLIESMGGEKISFMGEPGLFKSLYVFSGVWQTMGYSAVIYISALASVDQELHEAATVDGASIWQRILHIDIPSILPTAIILLIMSCGRVLSVGAEKVLLMQNSMNMSTSDIISTYVYRIGLTSMQYSYSTAIGLFQSIVSFIMMVLVNHISKKVSDTSLF